MTTKSRQEDHLSNGPGRLSACSAVERAARRLEAGEGIASSLAKELAGLGGGDVIDLLSLAHKVRNRYSPGMHACSIVNARSGECSENCRFCAQSAHHSAEVEVYDLLDPKAILEQAEAVYGEGIRRFGIVTSGAGYRVVNDEFARILSTIGTIREKLPGMGVCASLGMLGPEPVKALAESGIAHYNLNLQVASHRYGELICDTHGIDERLATIRELKRHGIGVCCGAILGVGESMEDRVDLAFALRKLKIEVIPLNVLIPIRGTPLEEASPAPVVEVAKTFALFRLVNPSSIIKFAAGRETVMKDFQGLLMLAGANGLLTGGYLTTRGRAVGEDRLLLEQLAGFQDG